MSTTASFVIDFGDSSDAYLSVELDSVLNNDKTSFTQGDTVYFRVYSDSSYTLETTDGTLSPATDSGSNVSELIEDEVLLFVKGEVASVSKLCVDASLPTQAWHGNDLGNIASVGTTSVQAANADNDSLGIATVSYNSEYKSYSLSPPAGMPSVYHILVYIKVG